MPWNDIISLIQRNSRFGYLLLSCHGKGEYYYDAIYTTIYDFQQDKIQQPHSSVNDPPKILICQTINFQYLSWFITFYREKSNPKPKKTTAKFEIPNDVDDLTWSEASLYEALKARFIFGVTIEIVINAIFNRSAEELIFKEILEIAVEVEDASRNAKAPISDGTEEIRQTAAGECYTSGAKDIIIQKSGLEHHTLYMLGLRSLKTLKVSIDILFHGRITRSYSDKNNTLQSKCTDICQPFEILWDHEPHCVKDFEIEI
ncbi:hypothetical protein RF11_16331 [Thelohanellus kitauei]|uniref:Uncharacterized protein n=1 Tax=Thelohanellus kitauei TaxID=669202 RepID=A0A0C2IUP6_THEKT|nr:hypothetical protein RF11_16331 [Thelohanellus kitauei]